VEGWWGVNDYDGLEYVKELRDRIADLAALAMEWEQELEEPLDNSERRRLHPHYIHGYDCALRRCAKELRDAVLSEPAADADVCEASGCSCDTCLPKAGVFDGDLVHFDGLFAKAIAMKNELQTLRARLAAVARLALCTEHGCHEKLRAALAPPAPAEPRSKVEEMRALEEATRGEWSGPAEAKEEP
jgi:hypothetical protein